MGRLHAFSWLRVALWQFFFEGLPCLTPISAVPFMPLSGENKAAVVSQAVEGPVSEQVHHVG